MLVNKVGVWTDWPALHWLFAGAERGQGSPGTPLPPALPTLGAEVAGARRTWAEHNHALNTVMRRQFLYYAPCPTHLPSGLQ